MTDVATALNRLLTEPNSTTLTPSYEGANIGTYIGFKHVNYLVEQAVLASFRSAGLRVSHLYGTYGLGFDIVSLECRIRSGIFVDDAVLVQVVPTSTTADRRFRFAVTLTVERDGAPKKCATATVTAVLRRDEHDRRLPARVPPPPELAPFTVDVIAANDTVAVAVSAADLPRLVSGGTDDNDPVTRQLTEGRVGYAWRLRIPYPMVHFYSRLQMSSYLRLMEEAKHRFVDARGISIGDQLADRNWIPAVTQSRLDIVGEALLEEDLYIVYTVESVFKRLLYTARLECYVLRGDSLTPVANGIITHGYGVVENGNQASVVEFDDLVLAALKDA